MLPAEPKEIKPHPYGVELGRLAAMLKETKEPTLTSFLTSSFSRVSPSVARRICETAKLSTRARTTRIGQREADSLYAAIQATKIASPSTDCISPIGEDLILKGLHQVVPGEFYVAATRPPSVYRGNPFQIEVGLTYGGVAPTHRVTRELLGELLEETDARTVRQFLINTFNGLGNEGAEKDPEGSPFGNASNAQSTQAERGRDAAARHAERQHQRRAVDGSPAIRQSRSAAVSACGLRDHPDHHRTRIGGAMG